MKYFENLAIFHTVYKENGHITSSAEILNLTKPTISRQIKALEARLGKKLFVQKGRLLKPTADADKLALLISSSVKLLSDIVSRNSHLSKPTLIIDFSVVDVFNKDLLYENIISKYENLIFDITRIADHNDIRQISSSLKNVNFIVTDLQLTNRDFDKVLIFDRDYFIGGSENYKEEILSIAKKKGVEFALNSVPWIMYNLLWVDFCRKNININSNINLTFSDLHIISDEYLIQKKLLDSKGIGLVASWMISGPLRYIYIGTL